MEALQQLGLPEGIPMKILLSDTLNDSVCHLTPKQRKTINAIREVIKEYSREQELPQINNPKSAAKFLRGTFLGAQNEEVKCLFLNRNNNIVTMETMATGGTDWVNFDTKSIIAKALAYKAHAIIVAHNHPSGNPMPSKADIEQTEKLHNACNVMDISLLDHIIIGMKTFFSFNNEEALAY